MPGPLSYSNNLKTLVLTQLEEKAIRWKLMGLEKWETWYIPSPFFRTLVIKWCRAKEMWTPFYLWDTDSEVQWDWKDIGNTSYAKAFAALSTPNPSHSNRILSLSGVMHFLDWAQLLTCSKAKALYYILCSTPEVENTSHPRLWAQPNDLFESIADDVSRWVFKQ